jgi:RimJ/RimL family protein N-acetyltransferase
MILTTERLLLRDFVESDWEAVLAYQQDPMYLRYYEWTSRTEEELRVFLKMFLNHQQQVPRIKFQFAVTLKSTGQLIGSCGVRRESPEAREGDMGYELDPKHWGNGSATHLRLVYRGEYRVCTCARKDRYEAGKADARPPVFQRQMVGYAVVCDTV